MVQVQNKRIGLRSFNRQNCHFRQTLRLSFWPQEQFPQIHSGADAYESFRGFDRFGHLFELDCAGDYWLQRPRQWNWVQLKSRANWHGVQLHFYTGARAQSHRFRFHNAPEELHARYVELVRFCCCRDRLNWVVHGIERCWECALAASLASAEAPQEHPCPATDAKADKRVAFVAAQPR